MTPPDVMYVANLAYGAMKPSRLPRFHISAVAFSALINTTGSGSGAGAGAAGARRGVCDGRWELIAKGHRNTTTTASADLRSIRDLGAPSHGCTIVLRHRRYHRSV